MIDVRITTYRADFSLGQWKGCTKFLASKGGQDLTVERCVDKANLLGGASADAALEQSLSDALSELLTRLDMAH